MNIEFQDRRYNTFQWCISHRKGKAVAVGKVSFETPASTDEPIESGAELGPGVGDVKEL
jgi:hypothetical protein